MIRKFDDKNINQEKRKKRSKETKPRLTHLAIFFFKKSPERTEDPRGGTITAKILPPPCDRSGVVGTRALEEHEVDDCLLQENKVKVRTKRCVQQQKNKKTTHRRMPRAASSSSSSSSSNMATTAPSEKEEKYSDRGKSKQQKDKIY